MDYAGGAWRSTRDRAAAQRHDRALRRFRSERPGDVQRHRLSDAQFALVLGRRQRRARADQDHAGPFRRLAPCRRAIGGGVARRHPHSLFPDPAARTCAATAQRRPCSTAMAASRSARCPIIRGRWAGSGSSRAMPMSSPICAAAASSGPDWHQTAQLAHKQRTWDDYSAVAEDLIRRRITSPRRLGVVGGSQGGLLVGTAITQRPELFNAAIIQVPLVRHAALSSDRRRRVVDRRIWRSAHPRAARLDRGLFALPAADPGPDLSDAVHRNLDRRRPRPSRPMAARPPRASPRSARLIIITRIWRAATPPRPTCRRRRGGWRWNIPMRRGGWWTDLGGVMLKPRQSQKRASPKRLTKAPRRSRPMSDDPAAKPTGQPPIEAFRALQPPCGHRRRGVRPCTNLRPEFRKAPAAA